MLMPVLDERLILKCRFPKVQLSSCKFLHCKYADDNSNSVCLERHVLILYPPNYHIQIVKIVQEEPEINNTLSDKQAITISTA